MNQQQQTLKYPNSPDMLTILSPQMSSIISPSYELDLSKKRRFGQVHFENPIVSLSQEQQSVILIPTDNDIPQLLSKSINKFTQVEDQQILQKKQTYIPNTPRSSKVSPGTSNTFIKIMRQKRLVNTFISNLKRWSYIHQKSSFKKQKLLEEKYLIETCNDSIKFNVPEKMNNFDHRLQQSISISQKTTFNVINIKVFEPLSLQMCLWQAFRTLIQLLLFGLVPLLLSFEMESLIFIKYFQVIFLAVLMLDCLVQLNVAYISRGQIVRLRSEILINYIKNHALKDILELGGLTIIFIFYKQRWIILIILIYGYLSIKKIAYTVSCVQDYFHFNGIMDEAVSLIKLVIFVLLICHVCACLWHFVGQQSLKYGYNSWILQTNLGEATISTLYNYSLYWATMTMVTVGYGDVSPQNDLEVCVATCTMFVTCGVFAFAINTIGSSLSNIQEQKVKTQQAFSQINQYMASNQVSQELQGRVRNYLEYCFQQDRDVDDEDVDYIFEKLPLNIKQELIKQIRGKALAYCKFINETFSLDIQNELLPHMEKLRYSPEEVIFEENAQDDSSIYMIQQGKVELISNGRVLQTLQIRDSFGERSFFTNQIRSCTVKAVDFVKVYKLSQESVLKILLNHPVDKEQWCNVRDQISLYEKYGGAKMACYSCGQSNHLVLGCPALFYKPDLERIIKSEEFRDGQNRSVFKRLKQKQSSLSIIKQIQQSIQQFRTNNMQFGNIEIQEDNSDQVSSQTQSENENVSQQFNSVSPRKRVTNIKPTWSSNRSNKFQTQVIDEDENKLFFSQLPIENYRIQHDNQQLSHQETIQQNSHAPHLRPLQNSESPKRSRELQKKDSYLLKLQSQNYSTAMKELQKVYNPVQEAIKQHDKHCKVVSTNQLPPILEENQRIQNHTEFIQNNIAQTNGELDKLRSKTILSSSHQPKSNPRYSLSTIKPIVRASIIENHFRQSIFEPNLLGLPTVFNQLIDPGVMQNSINENIDRDSMNQFDLYFPHNNYEQVIKQSNKFLRSKNKILESRYTLYYSVKKRSQRIRRLLNKCQFRK